MTIVKTPLGLIRGKTYKKGLAFQGIRYAEAPTGPLRFKPPQPVSAWAGVVDATEFGPSAPQLSIADPHLPQYQQMPIEPTDEDCLFLNLYTPATDDRKRAVLFWIHGGGYIAGSGRVYDGSVFVEEHDVVVVSINYRVGALGFMHLGHLDPALSQSVNNGILDQICALEWVRDNIAAFGGDQNNVTIFGESCGGTSTAILLGCPRAEGLFHKAVVHSPNVDLISVGEGHIQFTNRCIRRLGGDPETNGLQTLLAAGVDDLNDLVSPDFNDPESFSAPALSIRSEANVNFSPAIDGELVPSPVAGTVRARGERNVPIMGGGCRHEGTLMPTELGGKADGSPFCESEVIEMFAAAGVDPQKALDAYEVFSPGATAHEKLVYALTDTMFRNSMVRILDAAADAGSPVWSWMFTWETDLDGLRATHSIELPFIWEWINDQTMPFMKTFVGTGAPQELGRVMREYWVNFARTGTPNASNEPLWPPYDTHNRSVLLLDTQRSVAQDFDGQIRRLWF